MFRKTLCALVAGAATFAMPYPSLAATLGVTPPIRPAYPNVHLNTPLHGRIVPRFDHEVGPPDNCASSRTTRRRMHRQDCRSKHMRPRRDSRSPDVFGKEMR